MIEIKKILCPVDFSKNSEIALDYALALAAQHAAEVRVMHVLPHVLADPDMYPYFGDPVLPSGETKERALDQLGSFAHRARREKVPVDVVLDEGDIVDMVVDKAEKWPADLVILGTHGRRGLARLILGSVTERVLRACPRPVMSVSPNAPAPPSQSVPFENILCPIDFSPSSLSAYEIALSLAGEVGNVTLLHVVEFYVDVAVGEAVAFDLDGLREQHRTQAMEKLEGVVPREARARTKLVTATLDSGAAYREVLKAAEKGKHDVIVMGVMGRSAADMLFFGSTTNHVVREAVCPVLTVRADSTEAQS